MVVKCDGTEMRFSKFGARFAKVISNSDDNAGYGCVPTNALQMKGMYIGVCVVCYF